MNYIELPDTESKYQTVLDKNTFYLQIAEFEEDYDAYISSISQNLYILKNRVEIDGLREEIFVKHIREVPEGLDALMILTGFSKESFLRLITFIRVINDNDLNRVVKKDYWPEDSTESEWSLKKIKSIARNNIQFAEGIINLFCMGSTIPIIREKLPLFEFKKLDMNKLSFSTESMIDTLIRYKTKGSYSAKSKNNAETYIEFVLNDLGYTYEQGKLPNVPKNLDFIIPNRESPKIIIECSYVVTTSSGMGDKAKTEQRVGEKIHEHYPGAIFVGFVDGVGWYVRRGDLKRMVKAHDIVYTFRRDELERFIELLDVVVD